MTQQETYYSIPLKYRRMENLHIVFWLFKDVSWCMIWKPLGMMMILPTLAIAVIISIRNRQYVSELYHNLAITVWILANSYWMTSEFFHFDNIPVFGSYTYKHLAMIPFLAGILLLTYYYLWWKPRNPSAIDTM